MMFLVRLLISAAALCVAARVVPGIRLGDGDRLNPHFRFEKLNRPGHNRSTPAENAGLWGASLVRRASSSG